MNAEEAVLLPSHHNIAFPTLTSSTFNSMSYPAVDFFFLSVQYCAVLYSFYQSDDLLLDTNAPYRAGVYTTTRTIGGASSVLLWERHLARLSESLQLQAAASAELYPFVRQDLDVKRLVQPSVRVGLAQALQQRRDAEEIAFTVLLCGNKSTEAAHPVPGPLLSLVSGQ